MSLTTVIFDLDGTLLYTLEDLTDSLNYAMDKFGFPNRTIDEVRKFVGNGVPKLIERAIPEGKENPDYEECLSVFKKHYSENMTNKTKPYDGIIPMLKKLRETGYHLAVVSNKFDSAVKGLCQKYFGDLIDIAIGQRPAKDGKKLCTKPAPDSVFEVMKELGVNQEECIYIGDSEVDIQTARNAGIPCISVIWGYKDIDFLYKNGAETIIYTPDELLELI